MKGGKQKRRERKGEEYKMAKKRELGGGEQVIRGKAKDVKDLGEADQPLPL